MTNKRGLNHEQPQVRLGFVGIGMGAGMILPQVDSLPQFTMSAGADINPRVREAFKARYPEASVYGNAFPAHLEEQSMANQVQTRWIDATSETGKYCAYLTRGIPYRYAENGAVVLLVGNLDESARMDARAYACSPIPA